MSIKAKKSLGQNFLKSDEVLKEIIFVSSLKKDDVILEVGPGGGALTKKILEKEIKKLIIVEKDHRLIKLLEKEFSDFVKDGKLEIFNEDILEFDFNKNGLKKGNFKIIANLPYYITGKFLRQTLESENYPSLMALLLQKEVVERISKRRKKDLDKIENKGKKKEKESILSLSVKVFGDPFYITTVPAHFFDPAPKVDSAVLLIENISKKFFEENKIKEKVFFDFVKISFLSKRKKMIKNLLTNEKNNLNFNKKKLENIFEKLNISKDIRAEDLNLEQFLEIFLEINKE